MTKEVSWRVSGLDCESEAGAIERGLKQFPGLLDLKIYPKAAKVSLVYDPQHTSAEALKDRLETLGFPTRESHEQAGQPVLWKNPKVLASLVCGMLGLLGLASAYTVFSHTVAIGLYVIAIVVGGYHFGKEALLDLVYEKSIGIEFLMSVAAIVAAAMGQAGEGAMLVFLYSLSEAAEGYTEEKTRSAVKALIDLTPKKALVRREDVELEIPVEQLVVGDLFIVKPGQSIPTDGEVEAGSSSLDQAPVTGESVPVPKNPGDSVFAGSINVEGSLEVRASKTHANNTIARIIHLVEEAQEQKGKSQRWIEGFARWYSPAVLLVGILLAVVPPLAFQLAWNYWIGRATVFLVAAAPCALAISIPITMVAALGRGARQGVLIKGGLYLEELAKVQVIALDKTGTLTEGKPRVTEVVLAPDGPRTLPEVLAVAAGIEKRSQHPLALAILRQAEQEKVSPAEVSDFRSLTGAGATALFEGEMVYVGSPELFEKTLGLALSRVRQQIKSLQAEGKTVVAVGDKKALWGLLAIRDELRANVPDTIEQLRKLGIRKLVMLTGDNARTAEALSKQAGLDGFFADLKPEDKVERLRELVQTHGHAAMVGDGVNDAPALAAASVGVAMGAAGTDVALETADVALMADDLGKLVTALQLARRNQSVVRQNLVLSSVVIGALVVGALAGWLSLPVAVLGHELSEFVVIASGLRMLRA